MDVLVRREFGPLRVGRPGVRCGRGRRRPREIRGDDLEAVADRKAAVLLRPVAQVHVNGRGPATRSAGGGFQIRARVLDALVHERDVLRVHARVDEERDARRIRWCRLRHRPVGIENEHLPEDPDVFEPLRAFDKRAHVEPVRAGERRRPQAELEPRDLTRSDVWRGLLRDAIEARPSGRGRTELTVAAEDARLILTRLARPRAEVRNLAHPSRDPSTRSRVVVGERRLRGPPRAETHVAALAIPGRVKTRQLGRCRTRRSDTRTDVRCAGRARDTRPIRKQ